MKPFLALLALTGTIVMLSSCDALKVLAPAVANARIFNFHFKRMPSTYFTLAYMKQQMERRAITNARNDSLIHFADSIASFGSEEYHGNKENNTALFRLRAVPPGSGSSLGTLDIRVQDATTRTLDPQFSPGAVGLNIEAIPLPQVGDTITLANATLSIVMNNTRVEFFNNNNPNSYFRLVVNSLDMTNNTASGWFECLVQADSAPNTDEVVAITDGEFIMDIRN